MVLGLVYWVPFVVILIRSQSQIISSIDQLPDSDVAIVFGTLVNDSGLFTPLLKERVEAVKLSMY